MACTRLTLVFDRDRRGFVSSVAVLLFLRPIHHDVAEERATTTEVGAAIEDRKHRASERRT